MLTSVESLLAPTNTGHGQASERLPPARNRIVDLLDQGVHVDMGEDVGKRPAMES